MQAVDQKGLNDVAAERFAAQLNEQVANEFGAQQQYIAIAVHYEAQTLPKLAGFFYAQAVEERNHARMMVQYLLDTGAEVTIPAVAAPRTEFSDLPGPVALALEQEQRVTGQISDLAATARDEGDYQSEQFIQWFLKEQVEEVSTMSDLLTTVERAGDDPLEAEEWVARELVRGDAGADPTAPAAAGGAL